MLALRASWSGPPEALEAGSFSWQEARDEADESFEAFFQRHPPDIFGYLWRVTGEEQSARDLSQETLPARLTTI
jgi:hypothetical protein